VTKYIISPTPGGGSPTFPPAGGINAMNYCHGDGVTDDRQHILDAIAAAGANAVYFPNNTYHLHDPLTVPSGADLVGQSMTGAHLEGKVWFGSNQTFTDLKIGPATGAQAICGLQNVDGSTGTSFTRCHFRGGGSAYYGGIALIGADKSATGISFIDCEFERSQAATTNTVSIYPTPGYSIDNVSFDGCHFGLTNGSTTGCDRMYVECFNWASSGTHHWSNLSFTNCEFEASTGWGLDFACLYQTGLGHDVTVDNCTFHGVGGNPGAAIVLEWVHGLTITNNHFHRCSVGAILWSQNHCREVSTAYTITGNTFDWDTAENSIPISGVILRCKSSDNIITGNTFICHANLVNVDSHGSGAIQCWGGDQYPHDPNYLDTVASNNTITGNTFNLNGTAVAYSQSGNASNTFSTIANTIVRT